MVLRKGDLTLEEAQKAVAHGATGAEGVVGKNEGEGSSAATETEVETEASGEPRKKAAKVAPPPKREEKRNLEKEKRKEAAANLPKSLSRKNTKLLSFGEDEEDS